MKRVGEFIASLVAGATILFTLMVLILLALLVVGGLARLVQVVWA